MNFIPHVNVIGDGLDPKWSSALRSTALTVILLRAGWLIFTTHDSLPVNLFGWLPQIVMEAQKKLVSACA